VTTNFGKDRVSQGKREIKHYMNIFSLRRKAMVKKAKAHVAEAEEEDHEEEDEAYYVGDEVDEDIDGDLFEEEYDGYMMSFEEQEVHAVNAEQEGIKRKEVNLFGVSQKKK
jgi:hypothetical protein